MAGGAEFTRKDADAASKVAVLGKTPMDNSFGGDAQLAFYRLRPA
jgi:hypothetical protein